MTFNPLLALLALLFARPATDQCPAPSAHPYFDFQVEEPSRFVSTDSAGPSPDFSLTQRQQGEDFALAQFVVDTAGKPQLQTLRMLKQPSDLQLEAVQQALIHWSFKPATIRGCKVAQLVQAPLRWR